MKTNSTFFSDTITEQIISKAKDTKILSNTLREVEKWSRLTDDDLWASIFCSELKRSHMVLSYGHCPVCKEEIWIYAWKCDPFNQPWKMFCPECGEGFPKNDFGKYYSSGLNRQHLFSYELADDNLLYNETAPSAEDEDHKYLVDDGNGWTEEGLRWMFIGTYLKTGLWDKLIYNGIIMLARAYVMTGEKVYARKCGILLDRLADIFPDYDYFTQGVMFEEERTSRGYVSYWSDAASQLREMLIAYDQIFPAISNDVEFVEFVLDKSEKHKTPYRKKCFKDIQRNIENRIFGDAMNNRWKHETNYPLTDQFIAIVKMILPDLPLNGIETSKDTYSVMKRLGREDVERIMNSVTSVNGLTGEKGIWTYSKMALFETARLLSLYDLYDGCTISDMLKKFPDFIKGLHFFINTWFLTSYYPACGDSSYLDAPNRCIPFSLENGTLASSVVFSFEGFIWKVYKITGDIQLLRMLKNSVNYNDEKCFNSDFSLKESTHKIQGMIADLTKGPNEQLVQESIDYKEWKLALLHSGNGLNKKGLYLDYDSGGRHGHNDGMNIGIFAKGISFLPDFGYPPVHRPGGWNSKFAYWYRSAAAHNTVIVDGKEHRDFLFEPKDNDFSKRYMSRSGENVMWGIGSCVKIVAADNPMIYDIERYERMIVMIDINDEDCYLFDIFYVDGGSEHIKLNRGGICEIKTDGLKLEPYIPDTDPYGMCFINDKNEKHNFAFSTDPEFKFIRNTMIDRSPDEIWSAEWKYVDKYNGYFGDISGKDIRLKYHDLTKDRSIIRYDAFFDSFYARYSNDPLKGKRKKELSEEFLPGVAVVRSGISSLGSKFAGIFEPFENEASISSIREVKVEAVDSGNSNYDILAYEILLKNGVCDLVIIPDRKKKTMMTIKEWNIKTDADFCHVRKETDGSMKATLYNIKYFKCGEFSAAFYKAKNIHEVEFK